MSTRVSAPEVRSSQEWAAPSGQERILLLIPPADRRVLARALDYPVVEPVGDLAQFRADLIIADLPYLERHAESLAIMRERAGNVILPLLLATPPQQFAAAGRHLGGLAEDVVRTPISQLELTSRVRNLLRLRRYSIATADMIRRTETELAGSERNLRVLSVANEHLVRASTQGELLDRVCEGLVSEGGYWVAWVGRVQPDHPTRVVPLSQAGPGVRGMRRVDLLAEERIRNRLAVEAVTEDRMCVLNDTAPGPDEGEEAVGLSEGGGRSAVALPIRLDQRPEWVLVLHSDQSHAFDEDACRLLIRLRDNLAYGLSALREQERRISSEHHAIHIANHDNLTGVANRKAAVERLRELLESRGERRDREIALLFLDLDGFKLINDVLGHDQGDKILIEVARRLQSSVRDNDLVARQGGDEFLVIVGGEGSNGEPIRVAARRVAKRLIDALDESFVLGGSTYDLRVSIGIALYPTDATDPTSLLAGADSAMYEAKQRGGGMYEFFSADLASRERHRLTLERNLRRAVENGDLEVAFQPIVELNKGQMVGVEALMRWPQDDGSFISPTEFIPIAEDTGLILPISDRMIEATVSALARWNNAGHDMRAAINLSTAQMRRDGIVEQLVEVMERHALPTHRLDVELTETELMHDIERMEAIL
ncbi:diguanylate cyclase, partial [Guyparkeria sp. GHLCS8-2]|uniref:putative bifunctional diguanylate cyclase/phosphodiesterase n=1 Tax=Guyparkeria halopsychrophila TaxID=3139421 RepID=UPI0037C94BF1